MQALQNKAARTIAKVKFTDADHPRLLRDLGWLDVRNLLELDMGVLCTSAKINLCQNLLQIFLGQLIVCILTAESGNLYIPKLLHSSAQMSISNKGAKIWNEIPCEIRDSRTIHSFKEKLREHYMKMQCNN